MPYIFFTGTLTKLPAIYSYFSAPYSNNKLVFTNGKRLPLSVNQTIVLKIKCRTVTFLLSTNNICFG